MLETLKVIITPEIILDILLSILLLYFIISGWKKGILETFLSLTKFILASLVARIFTNDLTTFLIENTSIKPYLLNKLPNYSEVINTNNEILNNNTKTNIFSLFDDATNSLGLKLADFYNVIANNILSSLSFVLIFTSMIILIKLFMKFFKKTTKATHIGCFNSLLGSFLGFIKGILLIYILVLILTPIITFDTVKPEQKLSSVEKAFKNSKIVKTVQDYNIFK